MNSKVTIVQPYVPTYRVPFFGGLRAKLKAADVECNVVAGQPQGDQARRGDATNPNWLTSIRETTLNFRGTTVRLKVDPSPWQNADAVIMGLEGTSLPVYQALLARRSKNLRVGLWGHIRPYVGPGNSVDLWLERRQMMLADHIFAYTQGGARYAIDKGIEAQKTTAVMNTIDTSSLLNELNNITIEEVKSFSNHLGFEPRQTLCFIGGLDTSKRIDFLSHSLNVLWHTDPSIKVLIGGKGADEHFLEKAYSRSQAFPIGYLNMRQKGLVLKSSRAVCMPGRIGLIAVDALVAGRPIITTDWPFHAPESEYLVEGISKITTFGDPEDYAEAIVNFVHSQPVQSSFDYPKMDDMINNYASGVIQMLS